MTFAATTALKNHKYSQCHVNTYTDGTIEFVSYSTPVVIIRPDDYVVGLPAFNCSATTRKQVGWFLREYAPRISYSFLKLHAEHCLAVHRYNGDYISLVPEV